MKITIVNNDTIFHICQDNGVYAWSGVFSEIKEENIICYRCNGKFPLIFASIFRVRKILGQIIIGNPLTSRVDPEINENKIFEI